MQAWHASTLQPAVTSVLSWHVSMRNACTLPDAAVNDFGAPLPEMCSAQPEPNTHTSRSRLPAGLMRVAVACKPGGGCPCALVKHTQICTPRPVYRAAAFHVFLAVLCPRLTACGSCFAAWLPLRRSCRQCKVMVTPLNRWGGDITSPQAVNAP